MTNVEDGREMRPDEYKCARCGGVFTKGWSDEEAQAEYEQLMPEAVARGDEKDVICDDCLTEFSHDTTTTTHTTWQIHLLVDPYIVGLRQTIQRRSHWIGIHHEPLLDQLREAVTASDSGAITETIRRRHRESTPPFYDETAAETLSSVYVGIALWHARLNLPGPDRALDWQKAALRQLDTALQHVDQHGQPMLAPSIADDLAAAIDGWWVDTARAAGWRPEDLRGATPAS